MTTLHQQNPHCADFDVLLGHRRPSFRVLLPEGILGEGVTYSGLLHVIPGTWRKQKRGVSGCFMVADQLSIGVEVATKETEVHVILTVRNAGESELAAVRAEVCAAVHHLPGEPGWCNERFIPVAFGAPLDRIAQGRYWFEVLTPHRLFAFTGRDWLPMHPCPDHPDATAVPLYSFVPSPTADACACAVESADGGLWFFQQWNTPCQWCAPFPGNACMHMVPFLAERLPVGATASMRGRIGMHEGDRNSLENRLRLFPINNRSFNKS